MGHGKRLSDAGKAKISTLKDYTDFSVIRIAKETSRSKCVVQNFLKNRKNSVHVSRSTLANFEEFEIDIFEGWPTKSPDINIIANVWSMLAREVYKNGRQFNNKAELTEAIEAAWQTISQDYIKSLFDRLPRRIIALHDSKGNHTKY